MAVPASAFQTTAVAAYDATLAYARTGKGLWIQYGQPSPSVGLPEHALILYGNPNYSCPAEFLTWQADTARAHARAHGAGAGEIYGRLNGEQLAALGAPLAPDASVNARNPVWWQYWQALYTPLEAAHKKGDATGFMAAAREAMQWVLECPLAKRPSLYQAALFQAYHHGFTAGYRGKKFLTPGGHLFVPDAFASNLVVLPVLLAALRSRSDAAGPATEDETAVHLACELRSTISRAGLPTNDVEQLRGYLGVLRAGDDADLPHTRGVPSAVFEAYMAGVTSGRASNVDGLAPEAFADHNDIRALAAALVATFDA